MSIPKKNSTFFYNLIKRYSYNEIEFNILKQYFFIKNIDEKKSKILDIYINQNNNINHIDVTALSIKNIKEIEKYLELLNTNQNRQQKGSFFTPEYIVKNMIEKVKPKINDKNLDPSCGCGAFLIGLIEYYKIKYNKSIKSIVRDNIYGVDIEPKNIERTKLLLSIYALEYGEVLNDEDFNLSCQDSLLCNWKDLFPVKKFNNIIGNPPYISKEQGIFQKNESLYKNNYKCIKGIYDTFALFIELSLSLLADNGKNCFIIPTTLFVNDSFELIRSKMLEYNITYIELLDETIFSDAVVPVGIYEIENNKGNTINIKKDNFECKITKEQLVGDKNIFKIGIDYKFLKTIELIEKNSNLTIGDILEIKEATKTGNDKKFISNIQNDIYNKPLLKGKHIKKFEISKSEYIRYDTNEIKRPVKEHIFNMKEKLLIRRVSNQLICAVDKKQHYAIHTLYYGILKENYKQYNILYTLLELILNSNVYSKIYITKYPFKGKLFPEIRIGKLKSLPLPDINILLKNKDKLVALKQSIQKDDNFYKRLDELLLQLFNKELV